MRLLDGARYLNMATVSAEGVPWIATLEYAWLADPLRFVFGSATGSRHSRDVAATGSVCGSVFVTGATPMSPAHPLSVAPVDGAQFTGRCAEVGADDLDRYHPIFYESVFPDPQVRAQWMLPPALLQHPAPHRLYVLEVDRWWLIDTRTWEQDRIDRRLELRSSDLPQSFNL